MKKGIIGLSLLLWWSALGAQDPSFSQFYANRMYLNPAFTGISEGLTAQFTYRQQWRAVPRRMETYSASVEIQEPCLGAGMGFMVFHNQEGEGALKTVGASFSYAYVLRLPDGEINRGGRQKIFEIDIETNVHLGLEAGLVQKSIYWPRLVFSDQIDPVYGLIRNSAAQPLTVADRLTFADANTGILLRQSYFTGGSTAFSKHPLRLALGASVHHLLEPEESLYRISTVLPRRFTVHGGLEIPIRVGGYQPSKNEAGFALQPNVKFMTQGRDTMGRNRQLSYGAYLLTPASVYLGVFHHQNSWSFRENDTKSMVFTLGTAFQHEEYAGDVAISYDYDFTGIGGMSGGAWEVTARFRFVNKRVLCGGILGINKDGNYTDKKSKKTSGRRIMSCDNFY